MSRARRALGWDPVLFGVLALIVLGVAIVLGWQLSGEDDPVRPRLFTGPAVSDDAPAADIAGIISQTQANVITVQDIQGTVDVTLPHDALSQVLLPIPPGEVREGDLLIVGGVDDDVNNFFTTAIVVLDPAEAIP